MASAGLVKYDSAIPILIETLGDRTMRRAACAALVKFGCAVIPDLRRRLLDAEEPMAVRKQIPKALALTGRPEAAHALLRCLHRCDYHLDFAVLKALNRMRVISPKVTLSRERVIQAIHIEREAHDRLKQIGGGARIQHCGCTRFIASAPGCCRTPGRNGAREYFGWSG